MACKRGLVMKAAAVNRDRRGLHSVDMLSILTWNGKFAKLIVAVETALFRSKILYDKEL